MRTIIILMLLLVSCSSTGKQREFKNYQSLWDYTYKELKKDPGLNKSRSYYWNNKLNMIQGLPSGNFCMIQNPETIIETVCKKGMKENPPDVNFCHMCLYISLKERGLKRVGYSDYGF